jgi:hypothetical protein
MENLIQTFPLLFPVFFVIMWLAVTALLGQMSGWFQLAQRYPDRDEPSLHQLTWQSGMLGKVSMRGILKLTVCPSGLRIGVMRIFGPWNRDFFVPWNEIRVRRKKLFFLEIVELGFGDPEVGKLRLSAYTADRLARSSLGRWPEAGPFPQETSQKVFAGVAKEWAALTFLAALFFIVAPRMLDRDGPYPPIAVAIGFPAVVFGIAGIVTYISRTRR